MRTTAALIVLFFGALVTHDALAQPDRESLVKAWEAHVASLPGTSKFEAIGDGVYQFHDTDLPYEGELRIVGALARPADSTGLATDFTHLGMVDFELVDLPVERMSSQVYYFWLADRQTLYYFDTEQRWVDSATYQTSVSRMYSGGSSYGALSFMLNYGIWVFLIGLIVFVFIAVARQARKARALMDETSAINQQARENIDRTQGLQDEVLSIARENRELQAESNELLRKMLEALNR